MKSSEDRKELAAMTFFLISLLFFIAALGLWPYDRSLTPRLISGSLVSGLLGIVFLWIFIRTVGWKRLKQAWKDAKPLVLRKRD